MRGFIQRLDLVLHHVVGAHLRVRPCSVIAGRHIGLPLLLMIVLVGCVELKSVSMVEEFRVLGVSAEPPEIAPGQGTRLSVLWADPEGEGRAVSFAWIGCAGLLKAPMGFESCRMLMPPMVASAEDGGDVLDISTTPEDLLSSAPSGMSYMKATFIILLCAGGELPASDEYESIGQMDDISTLCKGGDGIAAYKNVTVSLSDDPQHNPEIESLKLDGEVLLPADESGVGTARCTKEEKCGAAMKLSLNLTEDSFQTYEELEDGKTVSIEEDLYISWFVTNGDVNNAASGSESDDPTGPFETVWKPKGPGTFTLYAVAHDFRGGSSWKTYTVEVLPK